MFFGESDHTLDAKNRVFLPKRFQEVLERNADGQLTVMLTRGFEGCLFVFSAEGFESVLQRLRTRPFGGEELRRMQRLFFSNTQRVNLDASGRLLIPEKLKRLAGLEREVVLVGVAERAEIWDRSKWEAFEEANGADYDALGSVLCPENEGGALEGGPQEGVG